MTLSAGAGQQRLLYFDTGAESSLDGCRERVAETGSNAGSDFGIIRYSDAGAQLTRRF